MSKDIKNLKPSKTSRYKQGYFDVSKSSKYLEKHRPCIYRSSWEWKFMVWAEREDRVKKWISEPFSLEYPCLLTGKIRHYNIDFVVDYSTEIGEDEKWLIEIKPSKEVKEAINFGRTLKLITSPEAKKAYTASNKIAAKNYSKWTYAKKYCEERGYRFIIVTEQWFNKK